MSARAMTTEGQRLLTSIVEELENNNDKISPEFINNLYESADKVFNYDRGVTTCVLILPSGHKVVGYAMVLNELNNDSEIGRKVAGDNAKEKLWEVVGAIAKLYIY